MMCTSFHDVASSVASLPASGSLFEAIELPAGITPAMLGVTVGAVTGLLVFGLIALIFASRGRPTRSGQTGPNPNEVVFIPPYSTLGSADATRPPSYPAPAHYARMGFAFGERLDGPRAPGLGPQPSGRRDERVLEPVRQSALETGPASAVHVAPVVVLSGPPPRSADDSAPHPLGVIPASSSVMMRAAPIGDLAFDDEPTEFCEPYFDEPLQPGDGARVGVDVEDSEGRPGTAALRRAGCFSA